VKPRAATPSQAASTAAAAPRIVLDHKTFPGRLDDWASGAAAHLPQLRAYARTLEAATGRRVTGLVRHLPVAGVVHEVKIS
jgi:hypothetical protein